MADKLQSQRFELKFLIDEKQVPPIRNFVRSYLVADEFNTFDPRHLETEHELLGNKLREVTAKLQAQNLMEGLINSYWVNSLYVDSPTLDLAHATIEGKKNRFKLRIRFYDEKPDSPVFFEIKQRKNDIIQKQRAMVHRSSAIRLLDRDDPSRDDLVHPGDAKALYALRRFVELKVELRAVGTAFVSYLREAYVPTERNDFRVTFDRCIGARPFRDSIIMPQDALEWPRLDYRNREGVADPVVLELKFSDRFPDWMHDLVETFNLHRGACAKYVNSVAGLRQASLGDFNPLMRALREELI
jgi:hypothetical protein